MTRKDKTIITGIDKLDKKFKQLDRAVGAKVVRQAMRKALKPVLAAAKANAPVKSGTLRRSIKLRAVRGKLRRKGVIALDVRVDRASFEGETFYAPVVEMGSSDTYEQPFMTPAFVSEGPGARDEVERLILDGLIHQARLIGKRD